MCEKNAMQDSKLDFYLILISYFAGFHLERKLFISNLTSITGQNVALIYKPGVSDLVPRSLLFSAAILFCSEGPFNPHFS